MTLVLDLDPQAQQTLEQAFGAALSRTALETLIAEGYRTGRLTQFQVRQLLGLKDRWQAESWLKEHNAFQDQSLAEVLADAESSRSAREAACLSSQTPRR